MDTITAVAPFNAKACAKLIVALILAYVLVSISISLAVDYLYNPIQWAPFRGTSEIDLRIIRTTLNRLFSPLILIAVTLVVLRRYFPNHSSRTLFRNFGFEKKVPKILLLGSFVLGISTVSLFKLLADAFPPSPLVGENPAAVIESARVWVQIVYVMNSITLVPLAEEFVFRGVLYKGFALSWNKLIAAVAVCILFTLAHIDALRTGYWINQLVLVAIPIMFVIAREITGSLYSPILIHSGFNLGSVFAFE